MEQSPRLIDANELLRNIQTIPCDGGYVSVREVEKAVMSAQVVDIKEERHGEWIYAPTEDEDWGRTYHNWYCSLCEYSTSRNPHGVFNFCHGCGAIMDKGKTQ